MAKSGSYSYAHCPVCGYWVPAKYMHYDHDDRPGGMGLIRICSNCLEGEQVFENKPHQYDPNRGRVQCLYCDSYSTESVGGERNAWRCKECGEISYILP